MILRIFLALVAIAAPLSGPASAQAEPSAHDRAIAAGYKAAFLCSGIFTAGQTEAEVAADDLTRIYPEYRDLVAELPAEIDYERRFVSVTFDRALPPRVAAWRTIFGCTNLPTGVGPEGIDLLPIVVGGFEDSDDEPWPIGDRDAVEELPENHPLGGVVLAAFDRSTYGRGSDTTAVVIVREGRIVAERYREGYDMHRPQRTWSVAKSIAATIVGVAVHQGLIDLDQPAPVPEFQARGDPRAAITWRNLLHMASGLDSSTAGNRTDDVYFGGLLVTDSISSLPLVAAPGTRWRYANNDTLIIMRALRETLGEQIYPFWPRNKLIAPLGMSRTTPEMDWQGNLIMSSQVWTTARDLSRLGLLCLADGAVEGYRFLPAGWSRFVATPAPAQPEGDGPRYGAHFWLFGPEQGLPAGSYAMMGNRGQYVMIVPERGVVIVRRGFDAVGDGESFDIARFSRDVLAAISP